MTIQEMGAAGELIGGIAVIFTLIYLALQIRQNTKSAQALTYSATATGWQYYLHEQSVEDLEILILLSTNHHELSHAQFMQAYYLYRTQFRRMEHDFYQYRTGTLDEDTWNAYVRGFEQDNFAVPGARAMWKLQSNFFEPSFSECVDKMVERACSLPSPHLRQWFDEVMESKLATSKGEEDR